MLRSRATAIRCLILFAATQFYCWNLHADSGWRQVTAGFQYKSITIEKIRAGEKTPPPGTVHLFRITPAKYKFDVVTAKQFGLASIDAKTAAKKTDAILAINGGFFTPEYNSLGLIVRAGQEINKLRWISWWHIFQLRGTRPQVITKGEYVLTPDIEMAIEAGPRLIIDGVVPSLKQTLAERTAIGITPDDKIIIAVTENYPVSMAKVAHYLMDAGCNNALNLDGGSSTQLYAKIRGLKVDRGGFNSVANVVVALPR